MSIDSSRRGVARRLLEGRGAEEALAAVPLVFSICAQAQACAAWLAQFAAREGGASRTAGREQLAPVLIESAREMCRRLLFDLPGAPPGKSALALLRDLSPARSGGARGRAGGTATSPVSRELPGRGEAGAGRGPRALDRAARAAAGSSLRALLEEHVLGAAPETVLALDSTSAMDSWLASAGTAAMRALAVLLDGDDPAPCGVPGLDPRGDEAALRALASALANEDGFELRPRIGGEPRETGSLAREARHPLIGELVAAGRPATALRTLARAVELARIAVVLDERDPAVPAQASAPGSAGRPRGGARSVSTGERPRAPADIDSAGVPNRAGEPSQRSWAGALPLGDGAGLGWVETARGLLLHRVELDGERIASYRILAPTEWNFHPEGVLARELAALRATTAGELRAAAERAVVALDPCVGFEVEVAP